MGATLVDKRQLQPFSTQTVTSNYSVVATDDVIIADTTSGSFTITLLDATTVSGRLWTIKKLISTGVLTITASVGLIEGAANIMVYVGSVSLDIISDGSNYYIK